jgi:hypothetical protein
MKKGKVHVQYIIGAVLVIAIIIGAYYLGKNYTISRNPEPIPQQLVPQQQQTSPPPTPQPEPPVSVPPIPSIVNETPTVQVSAPMPKSIESVKKAIKNATFVSNLPVFEGKTPNDRDYVLPVMRWFYNYYGTPNVDILEIRNQSNYFTTEQSFKNLIIAYTDKSWDNTTKWMESVKENYSFKASNELKVLSLENGNAFEYIEKARRSRLYYNTQGQSFPQLVTPYALVVIYVPCPPNFILQVWPYGTSALGRRSWTTTDEEQYDNDLNDGIKMYAVSGEILANRLLTFCTWE